MLRELRLSASADSDFQACQTRYRLSYIMDLTADKDKDSLRVGGSWHRLHEILEMKPSRPYGDPNSGGNGGWTVTCPDCTRHEEIRPDCYICNGTGYTPTDMMEAVARYLTQVYAIVPDNKTRDDWETERVTLLYSLSGHRWLYAADTDRWEVIGSEIKFEIPVINPASGRKMPKTTFVGKIDRLVRDKNTGLVYVWERKSTNHSITSQDYWTGLTQGDQVSGYLYGARFAQANGQLHKYGINPEDPPIAGAFCDVWRKPEIQPKQITKADRKILVETGEYFGTHISCANLDRGADTIVETPEMFGARLLADIAGRPEFYFAQKEVSRTDYELEQFQRRLFNIGKQLRYIEKQNLWVCNLQACEAKWRCEFLDVCRSGVEIGPDMLPTGYHRKHPQAEELEIAL